MNKIFMLMKKCFIGFLLLFIAGSYVNAQKKIIFITKTDLMNDVESTMYRDSLFVRELVDAGYDVTTAQMADKDDANHYPVLDWATLDTPNLVIIGYGNFSADFTEFYEEWAAVKAPVLIQSPYLVRSNRLKMLESESVKPFTDGSPLRIEIDDLDDPFVQDVTVDAGDGTVDFLNRGGYDLCEYDASTLESTNSAKLLATVAFEHFGFGNVWACRWPAGEETYSGGVTPQGIRSYFPMGYGHDNYFSFTDNGLKMWLNEVDYLAQQYTPSTAIVINAANKINLYYNSKDDLVQIRNSSEVERVAIYSITGQILYNMTSRNQESLQINASMLHNGVFIVKMQLSGNRTHTDKFVKLDK